MTEEQEKAEIAKAQIAHHDWFRAGLIGAGAPETITRNQVAASAGFTHSCESFTAGWLGRIPSESSHPHAMNV